MDSSNHHDNLYVALCFSVVGFYVVIFLVNKEVVMKTDKDDVPLLIQNMRYSPLMMMLNVTYFNGLEKRFCVELFDYKDKVDVMQRSLTRMQELSILNELEKFSLKNWKELNEANPHTNPRH